MKLKVEEVKKVEEGKHEGVIIAVEYREKPYEYTDLVIELSNGVRLKSGYPTMVTPESKLGRLISSFGVTLEIGKDIEPENVFIGKKVSFLVTQNVTDRGTFANVVQGTLKLVPEQPKEEKV
jgi:hypothetical protein